MSESLVLHTESPKESFVYPDIRTERGEFDRVAETFHLDSATLMFLASEEGVLDPLREEVWSVLENTDSHKFEKGDWTEVGKIARI